MTLEKIREQISVNEAAKARYRENSSPRKSIDRVLVGLREMEAEAVKKAAEDAAYREQKAAEAEAKAAEEKAALDAIKAAADAKKAAEELAKKTTGTTTDVTTPETTSPDVLSDFSINKLLIAGGGALLLGWLIFKVMK